MVWGKGSWPELPFTLSHIAGNVRIWSPRHATCLRKFRLTTIEPNPGPIYICPTSLGRIRRSEASVWCAYGGWLKCTNLERAEEWNSDFACHRCSGCCPAGENSSSNNGEAHCLTEALTLAAVPPQIEVTLDECTAKQGRRKRNRKAKRVRRKDKREQAWRVRAEREGKRRSTTIWTWNVQRARFAFPFKGRFTEILRTIRKSKAETIMVLEFKKKDPGIKWIKAGDFYGVLVHGKHSGVILKCAWASDWKEQGYQRRQGDRSTMVMVKNLRLVATYQPVWNGENEDFLVFREELDSMS